MQYSKKDFRYFLACLAIMLQSIFFIQAKAQTTNLSHFIKSAMNNSPLLKKQKNNNEIINLNLKQFNAIYKSPKININSAVLFAPVLSSDNNHKKFEWVSQGSNNYVGYDLAISNGGQYQAVVSVNQPLFTGKYFEAQQDRASVSKEQNSNNEQLTKLELIQLVTHQYILCQLAKKQMVNNQEAAEAIDRQINKMKPLVKAGIYKLVDLKLLEIELQNSRIEQSKLNSNYLVNYYNLNLLSGIEDTTLYDLQKIDLTPDVPLKSISLFLSKYRLDSMAIQADQKIFELRYLPKVSAFANGGLNAIYIPTANRMGFSVGVSFNWNIFDGHQRGFKSAQNKLYLENTYIDKQYFTSQNSIRKKNLLNTIRNLKTQTNLINNQLKSYNELLDIYDVEIRNGLISALEIRTLIKDIYIKKQELTNTIMQKEVLINSYNYWNN